MFLPFWPFLHSSRIVYNVQCTRSSYLVANINFQMPHIRQHEIHGVYLKAIHSVHSMLMVCGGMIFIVNMHKKTSEKKSICEKHFTYNINVSSVSEMVSFTAWSAFIVNMFYIQRFLIQFHNSSFWIRNRLTFTWINRERTNLNEYSHFLWFYSSIVFRNSIKKSSVTETNNSLCGNAFSGGPYHECQINGKAF